MNDQPRDTSGGAPPLAYADPELIRMDASFVGRKKTQKFLVICCLAVAGLFLGVLVILPALGKARPQAQRIKCAANLKNIGLGCEIYANEHGGKFPGSFEELMIETNLTADCFVCPESNDVRAPGSSTDQWAVHLAEGGHLSYVYVGQGLTKSVANPDSVVVAYEPVTNHHGAGGNFLFADGHVEWVTATSAKALIATIPTTRPATSP